MFGSGSKLLGVVLVGWWLAGGVATPAAEEGRIDRRQVVTRHNPTLDRADPLCPLTVGNGRFAFTVDVTGLQTFPDAYTAIPLSTQSEWGWHSFPNPQGFRLSEAARGYDTQGRTVDYCSNADSPAAKWLRANPHRLGLARIGFEFGKVSDPHIASEQVTQIEQRLDLWTGRIESRFHVLGESVAVTTVCDPHRDRIGVRVQSPLIKRGELRIVFRFAYGSGEFGKQPEDWNHPELHTTKLEKLADDRVLLRRRLDDDTYHVTVGFDSTGLFTERERHEFVLEPAPDAESLGFTADFAPGEESQPLSGKDVTSEERDWLPEPVFQASASCWEEFWQNGGVIDLSGSRDKRAMELERRIVLSQYLLATQCAGTKPPQETGLTFNSWFGKSHLEMHWWHGVQFALWNRLPLLERSLDWYRQILPRARETAEHQGYRGARWPKMVGPDGRESPSTVGVFLIWQQPHPIYYAELCYRQHPTPEALQRYQEVVFATADFMASYAHWDERRKCFSLGPPLIPAQEDYDSRTTTNPPFELEYWHWALGIAQSWRERLGLPREPAWDRVREHLAASPVRDGVYETAEGAWVTDDHPSHLAACGMLPGERIDRLVMSRTLTKVLGNWQWNTTWGWDYPMMAMTAARIGEPEKAVDALLMEVPKNRYLANGHNYQDDRLPIYLPGNGALLTATAMMAAGWDGAPAEHAPGFPRGDQWQVRWENLQPMP